MSNPRSLLKTHCNSCSQPTNHKILYEHRNQNFDEGCIDGHHIWQTVECAGCETVHLISKEYFSENYEPNYDDDPNYDPYSYKYFPPRNSRVRPKPIWYYKIELRRDFISDIYAQIYQIIEERSDFTIAIMLLCRSLLETIVVEKAGDAYSFKDKLNSLEKAGFITKADADILNKEIYDAGSATMHRSYNPSLRAISSVLNAIEKLMLTLYISDSDRNILREEKPPRNFV